MSFWQDNLCGNILSRPSHVDAKLTVAQAFQDLPSILQLLQVQDRALVVGDLIKDAVQHRLVSLITNDGLLPL